MTEFGPRGKGGIRGGRVCSTRHRPGAQLRHCCIRSAGVRSTLPVPCHGLEGFRTTGLSWWKLQPSGEATRNGRR